MQAILRLNPDRTECELELDGECFDVVGIDNMSEPYESNGLLLLATFGEPPAGFAPDTVHTLTPSALDAECDWTDGEDGMLYGIAPAGEPMVKTTDDPPDVFPPDSVFMASPISTTIEEVDMFEYDADVDDSEDDGEDGDDEDDE